MAQLQARRSLVHGLPSNDDRSTPGEASSPAMGYALLVGASVAAGASYMSLSAARSRTDSTDGGQVPGEHDPLTNNTAYQHALLRSALSKAPGVGEALLNWIPLSLGMPIRKALTQLPAGNDVVVALTEFVDLPASTTAGVMELGLAVRGELRVHSYTTDVYRALLKLAAEGPEGTNGTDASIFNSFGRTGADSVHGVAPRTSRPPQLSAVTLNDIVDEGLFQRSGTKLRLVPARCESYLAMTYETTTADEVVPAVTARECTVGPATTSGSYVLSVILEVTGPAQDVALQVVMPKRAELRAAPNYTRGTWGRPQGGTATEYQWLAGDVPAGEHDVEPNPERPKLLECTWEYAVPPETLAFVSRSATPYVRGNGGGGDGAAQADPSSSEQSVSNISSAPWQALMPTVTLSYAAPVSSSGLRVRKVQFESLSSDAPAATPADADAGLAVQSWVRAAAPPRATASYRTMYSQHVNVRVEL